MHENEVANKTWRSVAGEVIRQMSDLLSTLPPEGRRTLEQRLIESTASLVIELCQQIEQLEIRAA